MWNCFDVIGDSFDATQAASLPFQRVHREGVCERPTAGDRIDASDIDVIANK
jgi:hypothetical protein